MTRSGPPFHVTHLLLDVDGTLVDYGTAVAAAFRAAAARASALAGEEIGAASIERVRTAVTADPAWRIRSVTEQRIESVRRLLLGYGVEDAEAITSVVAAYEEARDAALTVYPDVPDALDALAALGLTMIAASNGNVGLDRVGIGRHISATHYAHEVGAQKPDPRFYTLAIERFGLDPARVLVVGDRLDNDYEPARVAGLHAVLLDRRGAVTDEAVVRIAALTELPRLIEVD